MSPRHTYPPTRKRRPAETAETAERGDSISTDEMARLLVERGLCSPQILGVLAPVAASRQDYR